jgi:molybdate transport system substrate-binding protein
MATFPNGATAMGELARSRATGEIGCTQVTEINYTDGVVLVGALPSGYDLATLYVAAVCTRSRNSTVAQQFVQWLCGAQTRELRARGGFEL